MSNTILIFLEFIELACNTFFFTEFFPGQKNTVKRLILKKTKKIVLSQA